MNLKLYFHPLSSFCQKVLVALYENATPFEPVLVDLSKPEERDALRKLYPMGKFPVLRDESRNATVPESTIIVEYLDCHYRGATPLIPADADAARQVRACDRFIDLYIQDSLQKIVGDRLRPADGRDPIGVAHARDRLTAAYGMLDRDLEGRTWAAGEAFTMADCSAAPALFYANEVQAFGSEHRNLAAYFQRLRARPSYARAFEESKPYFHLFPR